MSEVTKSVERFKMAWAEMKAARAGCPWEYPPYSQMGLGATLFHGDCVDIAIAYLDEHDPTPLSPEVLERFGFKSSPHSFKGHGRDMFLSKLYVRFNADKTDTILWGHCPFGRDSWWMDIPKWLAPRNVGELRCLLKRLEVPYEEKSNG